jgi:predicted translin family RNA/ssDNA-binding protein
VREGGCELVGALKLAIHGAPDDTVSNDSIQELGIPLTDFLNGVSHVVGESQYQFDRSSI